MTKPGSRMLALVAAIALLATAACGGGSDKPSAAEAKATAERVVLTSADVPGFTVEADDEEDGGADPIDRCVNNNPLLSAEDNPRGTDGDSFAQDDGELRVQSGATVAETSEDARLAFNDLKGLLSSQCVKDGLKEAIEDSADTAGLTVGEITATELPAPDVTQDGAASRLTLPLQVAGQQISAYVDLTVLLEDKTFAGVFVFGTGTPFPDAERNRLTNLVGERMKGKAKNTPDTGPKPTTPPTTGRSSNSGSAAGLTEFQDPSGVSFEHPADWTVEESTADSPLLVFIDPPGEAIRRNVNFLRQDGSYTLEEYTELSTKQITEIPGTQVGESRPTTLSGTPAYRLSYRGDLGSGDLQFLSVWTIRNGNAWLVTYTSDPARYDEGLPDVERLLSSVQLPE